MRECVFCIPALVARAVLVKRAAATKARMEVRIRALVASAFFAKSAAATKARMEVFIRALVASTFFNPLNYNSPIRF